MSILLAVSCLMIAASPELTVSTVDGQEHVGRVVRLDAEGTTVTTTDGEVLLPLDELAVVGVAETSTPDANSIRVEFIDGSTLMADSYTAGEDKVKIDWGDATSLDLPIGLVRTVLFPQFDETLRKEWIEIVGKSSATDRLVIKRDEALDYIAGVLEGVDGETIRFDVGGDVLPVPIARVCGIVHRDPTTPPSGSVVCRCRTTDGSDLALVSIEMVDDVLKCETQAGVAFDLPWSRVAELDFSGGKIVPLVDLKTDSVRWTPFFPLPGLDTDNADSAASRFLGGSPGEGDRERKVRIGGKSFEAAMMLPSRTELVYRLPDGFRRLRAVVGIDEQTPNAGEVVVTIRGDDRLLFEQTIKPGDDPSDVDADLSNVRRLTITVDYGTDGGFGDWVSICNARLLK